MKVLLDTHVLIWLVDGRADRLGPEIEALLSASTASVHVSAASLWEIKLKTAGGRLVTTLRPEDLPAFCAATGIGLLPITPDHVLADLEPLPPTRDPFDRLLLAQAQVDGMSLVTLDRALKGHPLAWSPIA